MHCSWGLHKKAAEVCCSWALRKKAEGCNLSERKMVEGCMPWLSCGTMVEVVCMPSHCKLGRGTL